MNYSLAFAIWLTLKFYVNLRCAMKYRLATFAMDLLRIFGQVDIERFLVNLYTEIMFKSFLGWV